MFSLQPTPSAPLLPQPGPLSPQIFSDSLPRGFQVTLRPSLTFSPNTPAPHPLLCCVSFIAHLTP